MTITLTGRQQSFNAIFRTGQIYAEAQVRILIQGEGKRRIKQYDATLLDYKPNYVKVNFDLSDDGSDEWADGERYMAKVIGPNGELLFSDIIVVQDGSSSTDYKTNEDNMSTEEKKQNEIDNDYIILNN